MSALPQYLPVPPRVWSRVENPCTFLLPNTNYSETYVPLNRQIIPLSQADYEKKVYYKGNILQYKGNSACLTKSQKYTQLAKGMGPSRTKTFATQTQIYSNPNTTGLLRVNFTVVPNTTNAPNPFDCSSNVIEDGGSLVCGTYANPCTGEIIRRGIPPANVCSSSTFSDVPGTPILLCWNNRLQTWFPRTRRTMNNSGNKWPTGYKGWVSASTPYPPTLNGVAIEGGVTLRWTNVQNMACLPISNYFIFVNGSLQLTVPFTETSTTISNLTSGEVYTFYVIAASRTVLSVPSNTLSIVPE